MQQKKSAYKVAIERGSWGLMILVTASHIGCSSAASRSEEQCEIARFEERSSKVLALLPSRAIAQELPVLEVRVQPEQQAELDEALKKAAERELVQAQRAEDWLQDNFSVTQLEQYKPLRTKLSAYSIQWVMIFGWIKQKKYTKTLFELRRLAKEAKQIDQYFCQR